MFYQVLSLMGRKEQLQQNLTDCQRLLTNCSDMIQVMIKTVSRGDKADDKSKKWLIYYHVENKKTNHLPINFFNFLANHPNVMGFDPMVNQRLLPPTFPRYTKIKPRIEALEYLDELLNRFKSVTKITSQTGFHGALVNEYNFFHRN